MRVVQFFKDLVARSRAGTLLSLLTPQESEDRGPGLRLLLAGGTLMALGATMVTAVGAAVLLLLALGALYYLLTQVLGIKLDIDPRAIMEQAQRYASSSSAPN